MQRIEVFPREEAVCAQTVWPAERGDFAMGKVFLRYRGAVAAGRAMDVCGTSYGFRETAASTGISSA